MHSHVSDNVFNVAFAHFFEDLGWHFVFFEFFFFVLFCIVRCFTGFGFLIGTVIIGLFINFLVFFIILLLLLVLLLS